MIETNNLVVGAGPSGLALATQLQFDLQDTLVIEAQPNVGGLCSSRISDEGAIFDLGGHSFHTPYEGVHRLVEELMAPYGEMFWQKRDARVWTFGQEIPYPFQQNFHHIRNDTVIRECEADPYVFIDEPTNFEEYIMTSFSRGVAEHFMLPYNRKIWKMPLHKMAHDWTGQRIAKAKEERFENANDRIALQPSTHVGYPMRYPFQSIFAAMARQLDEGSLRLRTKLVSIDHQQKLAYVRSNGIDEFISYDNLFLTIPMNIAMNMMPSLHRSVDYAADHLKYLSLILTCIELTQYGCPEPPQRLYCAGSETTAHKIAFNNLSSEYWKGAGNVAIMAESSVPQTLSDADHSSVHAWSVLNFLQENKYIRTQDVVSYDDVLVRYAYPIYTLDREAIVERVKQEAEKFDIHFLGRFGSWRYVNSDACIQEALDLAQSL